MRAPSPVLMNPREMKNARTISQMTRFPNPERAWLMVRVLVMAVAAIPTMATAPMGSGFRMIPTMVAMKIASRCIAAGSTPEGAGTNQITAPRARGMAKRWRRAGKPHLLSWSSSPKHH